MVSTAVAIWAWIARAPAWQVAVVALFAFALALWIVHSAARIYDAIASGRWARKRNELRIIRQPWTGQRTGQPDPNGSAIAASCYIRVQNITDDESLAGVRVQLTECDSNALVLPLGLGSYNYGSDTITLAHGQIEPFELFRYHAADRNRAVISFYESDIAVNIEHGRPMMIAIGAFGQHSSVTERFLIQMTGEGILEMAPIDPQSSVVEAPAVLPHLAPSVERTRDDPITERILTFPRTGSHLPVGFRSKALLGRSVDIHVTDAVLRMISDPVTTMEKDVRGPLWPLWPRRLVPVTLIGVWFERAAGTQFDIVLRNSVPPGLPGTAVSILEAVDNDGNGFLYSIYNHATGRWRGLNSFQGLWNAETHRPPVKWERWAVVVCGMLISGGAWINLLQANRRWLYMLLAGLLVGLILMATKAVECVRLWRFLGRAQDAVVLASADQADTIAANRSKTLNEEDR